MQNFRIAARPVAALASFVVFGLAAPVSLAVPVFFDFSGTCGTNCALLGVADGTAVSGFFETDDTFFGDNSIDAGEVTDFQFTLGNVILDPATFDFVIASSLVLNAAMDGFVFGNFSVFDTFAAATFAEFELTDTWLYFETGDFANGATGDGLFSRRFVTAPEPTVLFLLGISLIGFSASRRLSR